MTNPIVKAYTALDEKTKPQQAAYWQLDRTIMPILGYVVIVLGGFGLLGSLAAVNPIGLAASALMVWMGWYTVKNRR
jgi:Flp pilus assembly protein TadB